MLSSLVEKILLQVSPAGVTELFIWIMLAAFVAALVVKRIGVGNRFVGYTPTLLTTLGIFGTFIGIVIGLLGFNATPEAIDQSITLLLEGMKTAFTTSLVGMGLTILFNFCSSIPFFSPKVEELAAEEIAADDIYRVMKEQLGVVEELKQASKRFEDHSASQLKHTELLIKTIGGDNESSLTGQLKLMRSDANDNHRETLKLVVQKDEQFKAFEAELWVQMQNFAEILSKSATETVIDALNQVIRDFNEKLTEQFGENFKQLNSAVEKLVEWQENYKQQLADMKVSYDAGVEAISATEQSVSSIKEHTTEIPSNMENLSEVIKVNQHQMEELSRHLEAFADIRDRAVEAAPEIAKNIDSTLEGVKTASKELSDGIKQSVGEVQLAVTNSAKDLVDNSQRVNESLQGTSDQLAKDSEQTKQLLDDTYTELSSVVRTMIKEVIESNASLSKEMTESSASISKELSSATQSIAKDFEQASGDLTTKVGDIGNTFAESSERISKQLSDAIETAASQHVEETKRAMQGLRTVIDDSVKDAGEGIQRQVNVLDQALEKELNGVMSEMGSALSSITSKFTNDYQALVNEMSKVVASRGRN